MWSSPMPQIRLPQLSLAKSILGYEDGETRDMPIDYLSAQFSDIQFKWSTVVKEGYAIYYAIKKWRHYLEDTEILLKSDAKSLQKFLAGRTNNVKLDRWSLELHGRNIQVKHIPGHKNKRMRQLIACPSYPSQLGKGRTTP